MSDLKVKKFPDPVLRVRTRAVTSLSDKERRLLDEMAKTMYLSQGVGLAATQVGLDTQLAVIDVGNGLIKMVNPVIIKKEGVEAREEGCLSVPETTVKVRRAKKVTVQFMNERGETCQLSAEGLLARAIQHELDHLSGTMIIDYLGPLKKALAKRRITTKARRSEKAKKHQGDRHGHLPDR